MIQKVNNILLVIFSPVILTTVIFTCFLLFEPVLYNNTFIEHIHVYCYSLFSFDETLLLPLFIGFILVLPVFLMWQNKYLKRTYLILIHLFIYIIFLSDLFLWRFFQSHINVGMISLLAETNVLESSEFLKTYVLSKDFCYIGCIFVCLLLLESFLFLFFKCLWMFRSKSLPHRILLGVFLFISFIYTIASLRVGIKALPYFTFNAVENILRINNDKSVFRNTFIVDLYNSFVLFFNQQGEIDKCVDSLELVQARFDSGKCTNIVLIIGESFNKYHSSLYGYDKITNPNLGHRSPYVFTDVITSFNTTSQSFKNMMSLSNVNDTLDWCDVPLFPALFKQVGYNVTFWSNQFAAGSGNNDGLQACGFLSHPVIEKNLFDHRNNEIFSYDMQLIDNYLQNRGRVENDSMNLIIFQLMGQHVDPSSRYPSSFSYFKADDYLERTELSEAEKQQVANYDNATRYNDAVVDSILSIFEDKEAIIIYLADHGDEANDYRPHIGRAHNIAQMNSKGLHCQFDIPFIIFTTPEFNKLHPEITANIKRSLNKPFMTDDISQFLLGISGISTPWYDRKRDLLNPEYDSARKRFIVENKINLVDYDEICHDSLLFFEIGYSNTHR